MNETLTSHALSQRQLSQLWRLDKRRALVTGASKGIGLAVAKLLLERGAHVILTARHQETLTDAAQDLAATYGHGAVSWHCSDVTDPKQRQMLAKQIHSRWNHLDILINNVGANIRKPALAYDADEIESVFQTNLYSSFEMSRLTYPLLKKAHRASIVNVSSVAGLTHLRTGAPYAMTKAAMIQMTRNLAVEWAEDDIRVNSIAPWYIATPLARQVLHDTEYLREVLARTPMKRIGEPHEAAAAIVFFTLPAAAYITGQTLAVDGGFTVLGF